MKFIITFLFSLFFCGIISAQFPNQTPQGNALTEVYWKGGAGVDTGFHFRSSFTDTGTANLGFIKNIPGFVIRVRDTLFMRNNLATAWLHVSSNSSITGATNGTAIQGGQVVLGTNPLIQNTTIGTRIFNFKIEDNPDSSNLLINNSPPTTGTDNIFIGNGVNPTGTTYFNTILGVKGIKNSLNPYYNTTVGYSAMRDVHSSYSTGIGARSLQFDQRDSNVAVGFNTLSNTFGKGNTGIGGNAQAANEILTSTLANTNVAQGTSTFTGANTATFITNASLNVGDTMIFFAQFESAPASQQNPLRTLGRVTNSSTITFYNEPVFPVGTYGAITFTVYSKEDYSVVIGYNGKAILSNEFAISPNVDHFYLPGITGFSNNGYVLKTNGTSATFQSGGSLGQNIMNADLTQDADHTQNIGAFTQTWNGLNDTSQSVFTVNSNQFFATSTRGVGILQRIAGLNLNTNLSGRNSNSVYLSLGKVVTSVPIYQYYYYIDSTGLYLRNDFGAGDNRAYLHKTAFGQDTLALLSDIPAYSVPGIDDVLAVGQATTTDRNLVFNNHSLTISGKQSGLFADGFDLTQIGNFGGNDYIEVNNAVSTITMNAPGGVIVAGNLLPLTDNTYDLGSASFQWKDLYLTGSSIYMAGSKILATAGLTLPGSSVISFGSTNVVMTHTSGILTMGTGEMRITTPGTNSASVVTVGGTQTLTNKSIVATQLTGTLQAVQFPALTGDITTSAGALATTLATVNTNVGSFGSATQTGTFTVNGKGLITAASNVTITPAIGSITGFGTGVATALGVNTSSAGAFVLFNGAGGTPSSLALANATGLPESGVTNLVSDLALKAPLASPTFTGTVVIPTPFTIGAVSMTSTGTQLNYLNAATGTTGTTSTNLVYSTSPTLITPALGTPSALVGTNITGTASGLTAGNVTTNANLTGAITSVGNASSLGSFSSTNLLGALTDETGTGVAVFGTSPTITTSLIMADAANIVVNATTGTKFGTATTQKLSFYNSTPIVQPSGSIITAFTNLGLVATPTLNMSELTQTDVTTNNFTTSFHGFVPKGTNVGNFLKDDGTWAAPAGTVTSVSNADGSITITPTTGAVVATLNVANGNQWSANTTFSRAIATTTLSGITLRAGSAATVGTPVRWSPSTVYRTRVWNTGGTPANNDDDFTVEAVGVSGNPTTATLNFSHSLNGAANTLDMQLSSNGNLIVGTTNNIQGTATNNNAVAGNIGEEINSTISTYTNYTTTATYQNVTSIALTAGDWDISAFGTLSSNAATITLAANAIFVISTTTASAAGATEGQNIAYIPQAALVGTSKESLGITPYRISLSGNTTYYLNTQATFTIGNPQFVGSIRARRIR